MTWDGRLSVKKPFQTAGETGDAALAGRTAGWYGPLGAAVRTGIDAEQLV